MFGNFFNDEAYANHIGINKFKLTMMKAREKLPKYFLLNTYTSRRHPPTSAIRLHIKEVLYRRGKSQVLLMCACKL